MEHQQSLHSIERNVLPNLKGKSALHLQCHFGQDTISLATLGATCVVGLDFSPEAIRQAAMRTLNSISEFSNCIG